jgi:hypothetical protein
VKRLLFWMNVLSLLLAVAIVRVAPRWEVITLAVTLVTASLGTLNVLVLVASERHSHSVWYWLSGLPGFVASGVLVVFGVYSVAVLTEHSNQFVGAGAMALGLANASFLGRLYHRVRERSPGDLPR